LSRTGRAILTLIVALALAGIATATAYAATAAL
jgi:hypothetical protein